jgi:hypothetical protein
MRRMSLGSSLNPGTTGSDPDGQAEGFSTRLRFSRMSSLDTPVKTLCCGVHDFHIESNVSRTPQALGAPAAEPAGLHGRIDPALGLLQNADSELRLVHRLAAADGQAAARSRVKAESSSRLPMTCSTVMVSP